MYFRKNWTTIFYIFHCFGKITDINEITWILTFNKHYQWCWNDPFGNLAIFVSKLISDLGLTNPWLIQNWWVNRQAYVFQHWVCGAATIWVQSWFQDTGARGKEECFVTRLWVCDNPLQIYLGYHYHHLFPYPCKWFSTQIWIFFYTQAEASRVLEG